MALLVSACASDYCFEDGYCMESPSTITYLLRWALAVVLGIGAAFMVIVTLALAGKGQGAGALGALLVTAFLTGLTFSVQPGTATPSEVMNKQVAAYSKKIAANKIREAEKRNEEAAQRANAEAEERARLANQAAEREARKLREASPSYQLEMARTSQQKLKARLDEMLKTRAAWQSESTNLRRTLAPALAKTGAKSHEELLNQTETQQDTINLLNRAANLHVLLSELESIVASTKRSLSELDQQVWKLQKVVELKRVASPEEAEAVARALEKATELATRQQTPSKKEDIAAAESQLFTEILGKRAAGGMR
ncbi:hypothetical protein AKJ09_06105 [Labilithrix luteola]|uniref:Uncharacterized protein n=1 Tax=Labilithrix luteola TaxID=1391654 RepID=A0A0K1Q1D1_9BACT|nr:hypothetical protein [Labilithrix luteola]AKU99441.1 hypothetical protein AKJ09_06105 [Labilithrix luteola]